MAAHSSSGGLLLARSVLGIYASFLTWGYLQERVTAVDYTDSAGNPRRFKNVLFLNLAMGMAATIVGYIAAKATSTPQTTAPFSSFAEVALSNTLASPIGYAALDYISFPMLVLAKAVGIALFSYKPKPGKGEVGPMLQLFGLSLVLCNLLLDGYTNAKQEGMFRANPTVAGMHMMCFLNAWTVVFIGVYLVVTHGLSLALIPR